MTNKQIIRELDAFRDYFIEERGAEPVCFGEAIRVIREEVRPHGKWKKDENGIDRCSECGNRCINFVMGKPSDKFCIECGAKMDGGEE